jgi:aconitate hydratase
VGGANYGQGSSREHAAIVPRYLGLRLVIARSYARIHWQNLVNFGVLPLEFADPADYDDVHTGDQLVIDDARNALGGGAELTVRNTSTGKDYQARHRLSPRQVKVVLAGGLIPLLAR